MRSFATILLSLSLPLHAFAAHGVNPGRRHADVALHPRQQFSGERMTFYDVTAGTTACGGNYQNSDAVVAITHLQYNGGSLCGKSITITYNGKSHGATIVDECMGCPYGGLDLAQDFFTEFAPQSVGVISGDWSMGGAAAPAPAPTTSKPPPPPPTTHYDPPPQTTSSSSPPPPPPPSSTSTSTSTTSKTSTSPPPAIPTTSHQPSSSASSSTSSNAGFNNGPASSAAEPTGSVDSNGQSQSIESLYQAIINMGTIVLAANPN